MYRFKIIYETMCLFTDECHSREKLTMFLSRLNVGHFQEDHTLFRWSLESIQILLKQYIDKLTVLKKSVSEQMKEIQVQFDQE